MSRADQRGIALLAVLWGVVLLALAAASLARSTRAQTMLVRNLVENAKAEALADGGVYRAVFELLNPAEDDPWRSGGSAYEVAQAEGKVTVSLEDERGKIDLNAASRPLLQNAFRWVGMSDAQAAALADAIEDFRDPDQMRRPEGAEDDDYARAGVMAGAKDAPFESVEELQQVLGLNGEMYRRLAPLFTVYTEQGEPEPAVAGRDVLLAVSNLTPEQVDEILAARAAQESPAAEASGPGIYTIRADAETEAGGAFTRRAIVELTGEADLPYRIREWNRVWR